MRFTEERARDLLFTNPPNPGRVRDLLETSWFVNRPYAGLLTPVQSVLRERRMTFHPLYEEYMTEKMRESEAQHLRSRVRRRFRAIVTMKLFLDRWTRDFLERYYAPEGRGTQRAKHRFEESLRTM